MRKPKTKLERAVAKWLREYGRECSIGPTLGPMLAYRELMQGGCQSGIVGSMIYYTDTVPFYKRHMVEIDKMLAALVQDTGEGIAALFGDKWDADDPLGRDTQNQNLLAWFGFEETARNLMECGE